METLRVQIHFGALRDALLEAQGHSAVAHMTGNAAFSDLAPAVGLVQTAHGAYAQALSDSVRGSSLSKAIKQECRTKLETALHDLGVLINLKARGNQAVLETTGFPLVGLGTGAAAERLGKITGMKFTRYEGTGDVRARVPKQDGAGSYKWQYTEAPATEDSVWTLVEMAACTLLVPGLTIGKKYAFRVAGVGAEPGLLYSDPVEVLAI